MSEDIIARFEASNFQVNCTHLAEELMRRLKEHHNLVLKDDSQNYVKYCFTYDSGKDVEFVAGIIKAILQ